MGYREKCLQAKGHYCHICGTNESIQVHHIDGQKTNNQLSNLLPVCTKCHTKIHAEKSPVSWPPTEYRTVEVQLDHQKHSLVRRIVDTDGDFDEVNDVLEEALTQLLEGDEELETVPDHRPISTKTRYGLDDYQVVLHEILAELGTAGISEIEERFNEERGRQRSRRTLQRYLNDMNKKGAIMIEGKTADRVYSV
jgi:hypothetical protein